MEFFCAECRGHNKHNPGCVLDGGGQSEPPVNIPLELQERLFEALCDPMRAFAHELADTGEVLDLALERLRSGYKQYGSEMFTWTPERRRKEVMEELADAIVYLCSGPIE